MKPTPPKTLAGLLSTLRRCSELALLGETEDEKLLLSSNIMPKSFLRLYIGKSDKWYKEMVEDQWIIQLKRQKRIIVSETFIRANPRSRVRPIVTRYDVEKPFLRSRTRAPLTIRISSRDRLLLWYTAAKSDLSGSLGESFAIFEILEFFRLPNIQRRWKKQTKHFRGKLPEDAI